ncbi:Non-specific lipid transfer protein GPI-anchored 5, partial [Linum perenne]
TLLYFFRPKSTTSIFYLYKHLPLHFLCFTNKRSTLFFHTSNSPNPTSLILQMATNRIQFTLVLVTLAAVMYSTATAQSGCTSALMSLSPCLNYVSGNTSSPSTSCCSQLSGVVSSQPQCLCQLVNGGGSSLGITINQTRALGLPSACKVNTPSASRCSGAMCRRIRLVRRTAAPRLRRLVRLRAVLQTVIPETLFRQRLKHRPRALQQLGSFS